MLFSSSVLLQCVVAGGFERPACIGGDYVGTSNVAGYGDGTQSGKDFAFVDLKECVEIIGDLTLSRFSHISVLERLRTIGGNLVIKNNEDLIELSGLRSLQSVA